MHLADAAGRRAPALATTAVVSLLPLLISLLLISVGLRVPTASG